MNLTRWDQLLLSLIVGTATFAMYAADYLSGAVTGSDDCSKPERAACIRAHASAMRASIQAAMVVCTVALLLLLRPGAPSLSVVAVGMLLGFAYNASWLPGEALCQYLYHGEAALPQVGARDILPRHSVHVALRFSGMAAHN
jgi:hypothetical protein